MIKGDFFAIITNNRLFKTMNEIIIAFGILFILIVLLVFLAVRRWLYSWEGVLKEKIIREKRSSNIDDSDYSPEFNRKLILIFETPEGKIIKLKVNSRRFNSVVVGDRCVKLRKSWKFKKRG